VIHLDTSFLVDLLREQARGKNGPATAWLEAHAATPLAASIFVHCELHAGAAGAAHPGREREKVGRLLGAVSLVIPSPTFAAVYGATLVRVQRSSRTVSTMDLLIATAALEDNAALVTANPRHFNIVPDLEVLLYR
jgi:tRNA(fMet)-specific endonuclease VapC